MKYFLEYGWFHPARAKICWHWWKLQYCNGCYFLSSKKTFMKIFVLIKRVCKHSDIKFQSKNLFCKNVKTVRKSGNLQDFRTFFNIFANLIFSLQFYIWVLTHFLNKHNNFHKVFIIFIIEVSKNIQKKKLFLWQFWIFFWFFLS